MFTGIVNLFLNDIQFYFIENFLLFQALNYIIKNFINISIKYVTIKELKSNNIQGVFVIVLLNIKSKPEAKALFMFYNSNTNKISQFKFHNGKSYSKAFTKFVKKTFTI
jgi:hypothetical protein